MELVTEGQAKEILSVINQRGKPTIVRVVMDYYCLPHEVDIYKKELNEQVSKLGRAMNGKHPELCMHVLMDEIAVRSGRPLIPMIGRAHKN